MPVDFHFVAWRIVALAVPTLVLAVHSPPAHAQRGANPCAWEIVDLTETAAALGVVQSQATAVASDGTIVGFEVLPVFLQRGIVWHADGTVEPARPRDDRPRFDPCLGELDGAPRVDAPRSCPAWVSPLRWAD